MRINKIEDITRTKWFGYNKEYREQIAKRLGLKVGDIEYAVMTQPLIPKKEVVKVVAKEEVTTKSTTDIVIAFDTTGSMRSYIDKVKQHVVDLIPKLFSNTKDLLISIVAFGDYYDMTSEDEFGKAYQVIDLTNDQKELIDFVKHAKDTDGDDSDEFYELVIKKITEETSWREGSNKSILLIADCNPHKIGYSYKNYVKNNQIDWRIEANKAKDKDIKIDTLAIKTDYFPFYKELSKITNGLFLEFKSSNKTEQLLEGYTYARSGSKEAFTTISKEVLVKGDKELIGVYKQLGEL